VNDTVPHTMRDSEDTTVERVRAYLQGIEDILQLPLDDTDLLARVGALPGGISGAVEVIGIGLPAAFRADLAAGEIGTVAFVLDAEGEEIELHVELSPDRCRAVERSAQPTTVIKMPAATFLRVAFKQLDGNDAYMDGLVEVAGDIVLATGFGEWFDRPHAGMVGQVQDLGLTGGLPLWLSS
jgi:SCP-2 sterol transfer family